MEGLGVVFTHKQIILTGKLFMSPSALYLYIVCKNKVLEETCVLNSRLDFYGFKVRFEINLITIHCFRIEPMLTPKKVAVIMPKLKRIIYFLKRCVAICLSHSVLL